MRDRFDKSGSSRTIAPPRKQGYTGTWSARVVANNDPQKRGRIKVVIPDVHGDQTWPEWILPVNAALGGGSLDGVKYGGLFVPPTNSWVRVQFTDGDPECPEYLPGWYAKDELPALFETHYPERRGWVTPSGHSIYFDDSPGSDGELVIRSRDGAVIRLRGKDVLIDRAPGGKVKMNGGGPRAARKGDRTAGHSHTATHNLTADPNTGVVTGTITIASNTDVIDEASADVEIG